MVAVFAVIPVLSAVMYDFAYEPTAAFFLLELYTM